MSDRRGRPRHFDDPASQRVTVRLTAAQRLDLKQVAADNRTNLTGVIRDAVASYVADYRDRPLFRRR